MQAEQLSVRYRARTNLMADRTEKSQVGPTTVAELLVSTSDIEDEPTTGLEPTLTDGICRAEADPSPRWTAGRSSAT